MFPLETSAAAMRQSPRANAGPADAGWRRRSIWDWATAIGSAGGGSVSTDGLARWGTGESYACARLPALSMYVASAWSAKGLWITGQSIVVPWKPT